MSYTMNLTLRNGRDLIFPNVDDEAAEFYQENFGVEGVEIERFLYTRPGHRRESRVSVDFREVIAIEIHPEGENR